jgi:hypothetical protein
MPRSYGITNAAPYAAAPSIGAAGDMYWNTATKTLYVSDGATWNPWPSGGGGFTSPAIKFLTSNATLANRDIAIVDCTTGNVTITLPITAGNEYTVKRVDNSANTLTVIPASGNIDGDPNATLVGRYASGIFAGDGTNIKVEASYGMGMPASYYERLTLSAQAFTSQTATAAQLSGYTAGVLFGNLGSMMNLATNIWTCTYPGVYLITLSVKFAAWVANSAMGLYIPKNSTSRLQAAIQQQIVSVDGGSQASGALDFIVGDTFSVNVRQASGATQTVDPTNAGSYLSIKYLG